MKLFILTLGICSAIFATSKDLRLLSDNVPDWTDVPSAAYSMTNSLSSDEQKALAIFKWVSAIRHQVPPAHDSFSDATVPAGHPYYGIIYNPIKLANNYGNTFCVSTNSIPALLWKQLGKQAQEYDINAHTVCDLSWNGSWHNFDPAFGFCYKDSATGNLLGCQDVVNRRNTMKSMMSDFTTLNRFDPSKQSNKSIYEGKTVYNILIGTNEYSEIQSTRTNLFTERFSDTYTYKLNIKPFERYSRTGKQIADNSKYFLPASVSGTANPNTSTGVNLNIVANGIWTFNPDLSSPLAITAAGTAMKLANSTTSPFLRPTTASDTSTYIYRVDAANVISHAELTAKVIRNDANALFEIWFSADSVRWFRLYNATATGTINVSQSFGKSSDVTGQTGLPANIARTRVSYFLKFLIKSGLAASDCGMDSLKVTTITIVNPRTIPYLTLGSNRIKLKSTSAIDPLDVTYHWTEFERIGATSVSSKYRSNRKRVSAAGDEWLVNTAGMRNPTMDSVVIAWPGMDAAAEGYNDGIDVGSMYEAPRYYYTFGKNIAVGKSVTAVPDTLNVSAITDNQTTTPPTWSAGRNPSIQIDLNAVVQTGGVRILQALASAGNDYLDSCRTYSKKSIGDPWTFQGTIYQRQAWEPITNYLLPNTFDQPVYYRIKNRNLLMSKFSHAFASPDSARFVKLDFFNSNSRIDIQEIEIYNTMTRTRVNNEIDHGFSLADPSFTAPDMGIAAEIINSKGNSFKTASLVTSPNPFRGTLSFSLYGLKNGVSVISIFTVTGKLIDRVTITNGTTATWKAAATMPAGIYIARAAHGDVALVKKIVLSR
ncbi:MAG: T9SS type A sorting domain-containing protein [Fibrobacteres bacterium]|nr:T9SS type A sorting domain-containing protein [Fibrobacterota bacterium]